MEWSFMKPYLKKISFLCFMEDKKTCMVLEQYEGM